MLNILEFFFAVDNFGVIKGETHHITIMSVTKLPAVVLLVIVVMLLLQGHG